MKSLPLLSALLLSASPAVADDFVYLRCETKTQVRAIDAETAQVIHDFEETEHLGVEGISLSYASLKLRAVRISFKRFNIPFNSSKFVRHKLIGNTILLSLAQVPRDTTRLFHLPCH